MRGNFYRSPDYVLGSYGFASRTDGTFLYAFTGFGALVIEGYYVEVNLILVSYVLAIGTERRTLTPETQSRILTGVSYLGLVFLPRGEGFIGNGETYVRSP